MTRMGRLGRVACLVLVLLSSGAFVAASATAAAKPVSAERWAGSVCRAVATWQKVLFERIDATPVSTQPVVEQRVLAAWLAGTAKSTRALEKRLAKAGVPDVDHGKELAVALRTAFSDARRTFAAARQQVATLDTSDPGAFTQDVNELQQQVTDGIAAAQQSLTTAGTTYASPSLTTALADTAACGRLSTKAEAAP